MSTDEHFPDVPPPLAFAIEPDIVIPDPPPTFFDDGDEDDAVDAFPVAPAPAVVTTQARDAVPVAPVVVVTDRNWLEAQKLVQLGRTREKESKLFAAVKHLGEALSLMETVLSSAQASALHAIVRKEHEAVKKHRLSLKKQIRSADVDDTAANAAATVAATTVTVTVPAVAPAVVEDDDEIAFPTTPSAAAAAASSPRAAVHVPMVPKFGVCSGCQKALPEYGDFCEIDEKKFHAACVRCAECGVVLGDAVHQGDDGRLLCATHARTRTMHIGGALGMLPAMSKLQMQHEIATRTGEVPAEVDFEALRRSASGGNAASFAISDEVMRAAAASDRDESGGSGFARRSSLKTIGKTLSAVFKK
jgi:hypothetical protein